MKLSLVGYKFLCIDESLQMDVVANQYECQMLG